MPVYRNASTLPALVERIHRTFASREEHYEVILVDDASPDDSLAVAHALAASDDSVSVVALPRNIGQNAALLAGFAAAGGDWVVALDGDLQDPPEAVPRLLDLGYQGKFDVVFAGRRGRYQSGSRMLSSRLYKCTLHLLCGLPRDAGLCFVAHRRAVSSLLERRADGWILPMLGLSGHPATSLPVARDARSEGRSAYSGWGRLRVAVPPIVYALRRRLGDRSSAPFVCFAVALGLLLATVFEPPFQLADEGFRYVLSRSWARGDSLFERFMVLYPTGQYAYFGGWMGLLGEQLWVLRLGRAFLGGAAAVCLFAALSRIAPPVVAWSTVLAVTLAVPPQAKVTAMALVIYLGLRLADERVPRHVVVTAAMMAGGLAGWREDSAVLALVLAALGVALRGRLRELILLPLFGLLGFAPWWLLAASRGDAGSFVRHVIFRLRFLVERMAEPTDVAWSWSLRLPETPRHALAQTMPVLVALPFLVYGLLCLLQLRRWRASRPIQRDAVVAGCLGWAYLPQFVWERPDLSHFIYHLPVLLVAVSVLGCVTLPKNHRRWAAAVPVLVCAAVLVGSALTPDRPSRPYPGPGGERFGLAMTGHPPWAGLERDPGQTLIVLGWGPGWYAVEDIEPGTRFLSTFRRHVGTSELQAELVDDLKRPTNRWVITTGFEAPASARQVLRDDYCRAGSWRGTDLWERCTDEPWSTSTDS